MTCSLIVKSDNSWRERLWFVEPLLFIPSDNFAIQIFHYTWVCLAQSTHYRAWWLRWLSLRRANWWVKIYFQSISVRSPGRFFLWKSWATFTKTLLLFKRLKSPEFRLLFNRLLLFWPKSDRWVILFEIKHVRGPFRSQLTSDIPPFLLFLRPRKAVACLIWSRSFTLRIYISSWSRWASIGSEKEIFHSWCNKVEAGCVITGIGNFCSITF